MRNGLAILLCSLGCSVAAIPGLAQADDEVGQRTERREPVRDDDGGIFKDLEMGTFRVDAASPMGRRLGVGLELGWPTAVQAKLLLMPDQAIRASIGAFSGIVLTEPAFAVSVDYLYHPLTLARSEAFVLHTHVGAGGGMLILPVVGKRSTIPAALYYRGPTQLWTTLRVPVGLDLAFKQLPVDITAELTPTIMTFPGVSVGLGASIGARWWW